MQNLTIGLVKEEPGWIQILMQEGLSFSEVDIQGRIDVKELGALVVNRPLGEEERNIVHQYLYEGGAVLTEMNILSQVHPVPVESCRVDYIEPTKDDLWKNISLVELGTRGFSSRDARLGRINGKRTAIFKGSVGKGVILGLPFDVHRVLSDSRSKRKAFYYEKANKFPDETVSLVSKGEVRKLVVRCLRVLFQMRGIPYLHLSYYPEEYKNTLILRMDTDISQEKDIDKIENIARRLNISLTWFVNVKHQEKMLDKIVQLEKDGQEIGVHCYLHRTFPDYRRNYENIRKAKELLSEAGIHTVGYASPYGSWNENLCRAVEELGFGYSSEFALDYDDLPFYPVLGNRPAKVLQIPIHPVSIGSLRHAGFEDNDMRDYYQFVIERKWKQGEPMMFYSHPEHGNEGVIDFIVRTCKKKEGVWITTMSSFMKWWKRREGVAYSAGWENEDFFIHGENPGSQVSFHVISPEGKEGWISWKERFGSENISWKDPGEGLDYDNRIIQTRQMKGRLLLKDLEAWFNRIRKKGF
jgi:hypothetical protein